MTNPYYHPSGIPATRAQLSSSAMRTELNSIKMGFEKLAPTLTANALLHVNAAGTQQTAHASITVSAAGAVAGITDLAYSGTLTGSTGVLNIGAGQIYKDAAGSVGIGRTPSGSAVLDVKSDANGIVRVRGGTASDQGAAFFGVSGSDASRFAFGQVSRIFGGTPGNDAVMYSAGNLILASGAVERMRLDSAGSVGVGVVPAALLHIKATSPVLQIETSASLAAAGSAYINFNGSNGDSGYLGFGGTASRLDIYNRLAGDVIIGTDNIERMRIDGSGNVGIGAPAPGAKLHVNGSVRIDVAVQATNSGAGGAAALPAAPAGYAIINIGGVDRLFPYYPL